MKTRDDQRLAFHLPGKEPDKSDKIFENEIDNDDGDELGKIIDERHQDALHRAPDHREDSPGDPFCCRENAENHREGDKEYDDDQCETEKF